jgi:hypothetical protein
VLDAFLAACSEGTGWKTDYNLAYAAELLNDLDHKLAVEIALRIERPSRQRTTLRRVGEADPAVDDLLGHGE